MIKDKDTAARLALDIAALAFTDPAHAKVFEEELRPQAERMFNDTLHYRFGPEALFIHESGLRAHEVVISWERRPDEVRLAFTLYTAVVPILAPLIAPVATAEAPGTPAAGRGFETVDEDSSNRGSIYERETLTHAAPGAATEAAAGDPQNVAPAGAQETGDGVADAPVATDAATGAHGAGAGAADPGGGAAGPSADATPSPQPPLVDRTDPNAPDAPDGAPAPAAGVPAAPEDVTANTDPAPYVTLNEPGVYGEVVDDDGADDDDDVTDTAPPPEATKGRKRR